MSSIQSNWKKKKKDKTWKADPKLEGKTSTETNLEMMDLADKEGLVIKTRGYLL